MNSVLSYCFAKRFVPYMSYPLLPIYYYKIHAPHALLTSDIPVGSRTGDALCRTATNQETVARTADVALTGWWSFDGLNSKQGNRICFDNS